MFVSVPIPMELVNAKDTLAAISIGDGSGWQSEEPHSGLRWNGFVVIRKIIVEMTMSWVEMGGVCTGDGQPLGWRCSANKPSRTGEIQPIRLVCISASRPICIHDGSFLFGPAN
jgi:hypothetical protein